MDADSSADLVVGLDTDLTLTLTDPDGAEAEWTVTLLPAAPAPISLTIVSNPAGSDYGDPSLGVDTPADPDTTATAHILSPEGTVLATPITHRWTNYSTMQKHASLWWNHTYDDRSSFPGNTPVVVRMTITNLHGLSTSASVNVTTRSEFISGSWTGTARKSPEPVVARLEFRSHPPNAQLLVIPRGSQTPIRTIVLHGTHNAPRVGWNGRDDAGALAPTNHYRFAVSLANAYGTRTIYPLSGEHYWDVTPPTVTIKATIGKRTVVVGPKTRLTPSSKIRIVVTDNARLNKAPKVTATFGGTTRRLTSTGHSSHSKEFTLRSIRGWWPQRSLLTWTATDERGNITEDSMALTIKARVPTLTARIAGKYAEQAFARGYGNRYARDRRVLKRTFRCKRISRTARRCSVTMYLKHAPSYRFTTTQVVRYRMVRGNLVTDVSVRGRQRWDGRDGAGKKRGKAINRRLSWTARINGPPRPTAHDLDDPIDRFPAP